MESLPSRTEVVTIMNHVNKTWQQRNPRHGNHFWNRAVYHVGNMAAYEVAKEQQYLDYSTAWAGTTTGGEQQATTPQNGRHRMAKVANMYCLATIRYASRYMPTYTTTTQTTTQER